MAKLYRHPEDGGFYDAFGRKIEIGEVEEIWAGDSFDRGTMDCCYTTADVSNRISAEPISLSFTVKNSDWNADALTTLSGTVSDYASKTEVSTITESIANLQKQIDELRDKAKVESKLRNELRTLRYVREVV